MATEARFLQPLVSEPFEKDEILQVKADEKSRVRVKGNFYSVPASMVSATLSVRLTPAAVHVTHNAEVVASHERRYEKGQQVLVLDHYLDVLSKKPCAMPGSIPLRQARQTGLFPSSYDRLWSALVSKGGQSGGTRQMIEVLLLHRRHSARVVREAVDKSLDSYAIDPQAVALFCRHIEAGPSPKTDLQIDVGPLSAFDRPPPKTLRYDELLKVAQ